MSMLDAGNPNNIEVQCDTTMLNTSDTCTTLDTTNNNDATDSLAKRLMDKKNQRKLALRCILYSLLGTGLIQFIYYLLGWLGISIPSVFNESETVDMIFSLLSITVGVAIFVVEIRMAITAEDAAKAQKAEEDARTAAYNIAVQNSFNKKTQLDLQKYQNDIRYQLLNEWSSFTYTYLAFKETKDNYIINIGMPPQQLNYILLNEKCGMRLQEIDASNVMLVDEYIHGEWHKGDDSVFVWKQIQNSFKNQCICYLTIEYKQLQSTALKIPVNTANDTVQFKNVVYNITQTIMLDGTSSMFSDGVLYFKNCKAHVKVIDIHLDVNEDTQGT